MLPENGHTCAFMAKLWKKVALSSPESGNLESHPTPAAKLIENQGQRQPQRRAKFWQRNRQTWRRRGWKFAVLVVIFYLIRDLTIYILFPLFVVSSICK